MSKAYCFCLFILSIFSACTEEKLFKGRFSRAIDQKDVFIEDPASKVDILWIVDNSFSMMDEQEKLAKGFLPFFKQLVDAKVDYHIGVITTDISEKGILREFTGPKVPGCDSCRYLDTKVPRENVDAKVDYHIGVITTDISEKGILREFTGPKVPGCDSCRYLDTKVPRENAEDVFSNLIKVGTSGGSLEQGFLSAKLALSNFLENKGFLRDQASLFLIFVSDEDEGLKEAGEPIEYYQRFFSSLKGKGNENLVKVSAITGWPLRKDAVSTNKLFALFDQANNSNIHEKELDDALKILQNRELCTKRGKISDTVAETGARYIKLSYLLNGVFSNLCKSDYSLDLEKLGASAAGLRKRFKLMLADKIESGPDGILFSKDDLLLDCNNDGKLDSPICVYAQSINSNGLLPIDLDPVWGWTFDQNGPAILFSRNFFPKPGTEIHVHYKLYQAMNP